MKSTTALALLMMFTFFGCRKTEVTTAAAGGFTAVIDGKSWVATDSSIRVSLLNGILTISGQSSDGQTITILLEDTVQRPYTLNENSVSMATYFDEQDNSTLEFRYLSTNQSYNASLSGGAVLLNEVDNLNKTISGIFSFNVYIDSANYRKVITEGSFTNLPYINSLPPTATTDTFTVQTNGVQWTAQSVSLNKNLNGLFLITGSSLNATESVGIYIPIAPCDNCDSLYYLSYFFGQFNNGKISEFNTFGSATDSLVLFEYNLVTRRISGKFSFNANPVSRSYNLTVPNLPPPNQGNFIYYDTSAQPVVLTNGYFSIGF